MIGYPKIIATRQDYINILSMPEYKDRCVIDLQKIVDFQDDTVRQSIDENSYIEIPNPNPIYKQKGFGTRQEIIDLINQYINRKDLLLDKKW